MNFLKMFVFLSAFFASLNSVYVSFVFDSNYSSKKAIRKKSQKSRITIVLK